MTDRTQLEETLDLPSLKEALKQADESKVKEEENLLAIAEGELEEIKLDSLETAESFQEAMAKTQTLEDKLADKAGLREHDVEMNEIAQEAMDSYHEMKDLGMNVNPGHAGKLFETATQMLKIAMEAKNAKSDKKLRMWRLQIDQARLFRDLDRDRGTGPIDGVIDNDTIRMDRNKLIQEALRNIEAGKPTED